LSELDRFGGRGAGHLVISGGILSDRVQDLQELGAIGGTVQEGGCQVASHGRMLVCGLERKGERIRGPSSSPPSQRHRWQGHSMQPRHQCCRCGVRSAPPSCSVGTSPKGSPKGHRTQHMPLRCCTGTHRCRSRGQRSRFRNLPNRSWSVVSFELRSV